MWEVTDRCRIIMRAESTYMGSFNVPEGLLAAEAARDAENQRLRRRPID
jgi:hypothetical protein